MPFWTGETAKPDTGPSTLRVAPDQVLRLKGEIQAIHDDVDKFLNRRGRAMAMPALGSDPVSFDAAHVFSENAQAAVDAAWGYLAELKNVLGALDQAVKTYDLVEDANTHSFRQDIQ